MLTHVCVCVCVCVWNETRYCEHVCVCVCVRVKRHCDHELQALLMQVSVCLCECV